MKDSASLGVPGELEAWWNTGAGWNTIGLAEAMGLARAGSARLVQVRSGGRVTLLLMLLMAV
jgi:hypothetical protein